MPNCIICNGSMALKEVVEAADPELDDTLCRKHLQEVYNEL